eukprot:6660205-Pyramimonas_sp.AAC.1
MPGQPLLPDSPRQRVERRDGRLEYGVIALPCGHQSGRAGLARWPDLHGPEGDRPSLVELCLVEARDVGAVGIAGLQAHLGDACRRAPPGAFAEQHAHPA